MDFSNPDVQRLTEKKNRRALMRALKDAGSDTSVPLISALISASGEISTPQVVEALIKALADSNSDVRQAARTALDRLGYTRASELETLIIALRDDNRKKRVEAAILLGRLGDPRAIEPLIDALRDNNSWERKHITVALIHIGAIALEALISTLGDNNPWMRKQAREALVGIGPLALKPLIIALGNDNSQIRKQAAMVLVQLGDLRAVEPLIATIGDDDREIREQAITILGQLGDLRAVDLLVSVLEERNRPARDRALAAKALGQLGDSRAVEPLIAALGDRDPWTRELTVSALGQIGNSRAVESLVNALVDSNHWVREKAIVALGMLGWQPTNETQSVLLAVAQKDWNRAVSFGMAALEPLVAVLEDDSIEIREQAAKALGQIGDSRAVEPLINMLNSNYYRVHTQATDALVSIGSAALEPLIGVLENTNEKTRRQAITILGRIGDSRAVEPLIEVLKDSKFDEDTRATAASALRKIGAPVDVNLYLEKALEPSSYHARHDANHFGAFYDADSALKEVQRTVESKNATNTAQQETSYFQPQLRYLHVRHPDRVRVGDRIPLQVRVALSPTLSKSAPLRAFSIPSQGIDLKLVLDCPGFLLHSASIVTIHVVSETDSDWALFELEALHDGVSTLEVSAFHGGAFLGTVSTQLTVDHLAVRKQNVEHLAFLSLRPPKEGEVTLVIRYDPFSSVYRYQFRSATFGETDELTSGPLRRKQEEAITDLITSLNEQAHDVTGYSAEETRRWLQGKGTELWNELIPKELENIFWQQRDKIKCMTILSAGDPMPWEVMYPTNDAGDDAGFLAEQFPVVRWMFGPAPTSLLHCTQPFFVLPDDAPPTAENELVALRRIIGDGRKVNELTPLLSVFDRADFDMLHFACHNIFRPDSPTASGIEIGSKRFVPTFLSKYKGHFYQRSPLVFLNACRSDGMAANYTWLA